MGAGNWITLWFDDNYNIVDDLTGVLELDDYVVRLRGNEVRVFKKDSEVQEFGMIGGYVYLYDFCITSVIEDVSDQVVILKCFSDNDEMRVYYGISGYKYLKIKSFTGGEESLSRVDFGLQRPLVERLILLDVESFGDCSILERDKILDMFKRYKVHNEYTDEPIWG